MTEQDFIDKPYIINVPIESRSISFENPTGAKGAGGKAASKLGQGRKGSPLREVAPGETVTLCDIKGPGVIRHIWMTVRSTPENLLGFVVRGYWDGQEYPSIEAPVGSFFGSAHGKSAPLSISGARAQQQCRNVHLPSDAVCKAGKIYDYKRRAWRGGSCVLSD